MVCPQASSSEKKVTSKYWAGEYQATTLRGKSVPALGNKRAAPECDDSTGLEAGRLRRKHAKTFDFKPAHDLDVEVKDEPVSTQPPSDPPLPLAEQPQSNGLQPTIDPSVPIEPLPPAVTAPVRPISSAVPVKPLPPSSPFRLSPSRFPAKSSSPVVVVKPACNSSHFEASIRRQKPPARPRSPREEEAVIATLAHICDESVVEATINLVLRWGREAPNPSGKSDDLGISYLKGIVARVDKHGIEPDRRVVIIGLLCSRYTRHLEDLKSRIETLSAPQLPLSSPSSSDQPVQPGENAHESVAHENDRRTDFLASLPSPPEDNDEQIAQNGQRQRHRLEQQTASAEAIDADQDTPLSPAKSLANTTTTTSKKAALPKQPLDVFQEAALAARNFTTGEKGQLPEF
jgi:hypothetical protein